MGWFGEQISQRQEADRRMLEEAFIRLSGVVMGRRSAEQHMDERAVTKTAINEILRYYHCRAGEIPEKVTVPEEQMDYCLSPHGIMRRSVRLRPGWHRDALGPMIVRTKTGVPVAVLPNRVRGYWYRDDRTGSRILILNRREEELFGEDAVCFYRGLPARKLSIRDLMLFMLQSVALSDVIRVMLATLAITAVGLLIPRVTRAMTGPILEAGAPEALINVLICLVCFTVSAKLIELIRGALTKRLETKTSLSVSSALIIRMISLPTGFFRRFSAGELKSRILSVNQLCTLLFSLILGTGFSAVSSLLYVTQIAGVTPILAVPSLMVIVVSVLFSTYVSLLQIRISKKQMEYSAAESGMSYSLIRGIEKIRLAGAENRVFARWMKAYTDSAEMAYNPPMTLKISGVIQMAISLLSTILIYRLAIRGGVDVPSYFAFNAAYGMVMGAFSALAGTVTTSMKIKPILDMARPFLEEVPENREGKEPVTSLSGQIEISHVSFRYSPETPYIFNDLSLKINRGEYVAIVGRTGCGKSTLLRLLLGFEKPQMGTIFYDGRDISNLELSSLRRKIGTVLQSDGLFQGDIYSNIVITAPELTEDAAWKAAETAGIADDIRAMPMGMHTMVSEGQGGISGGQKQRLMIARAIAPNPCVLFFDEATSALDNKTQRQVSEALDRMGCTRLVIAHRLSTIRNCDRILVLEGGSIIEDGTYEELIRKGGFFAELVERQRLDVDIASEKA